MLYRLTSFDFSYGKFIFLMYIYTLYFLLVLSSVLDSVCFASLF